jgi:hypothetical protein
MVDGKRCAIPLAAPKVYSSRAEGGGVRGATAAELAENTIYTIKNHLSEDCLVTLVGIAADGQYQARDFHRTLQKLLMFDESEDFFCVTWDPGHWMNHAVTDIRDGKCGTSSAFMKYFIK